jgi:hypothetical protein
MPLSSPGEVMAKQIHRVVAERRDVVLMRDPKTGLMVAALQNDYGTPERSRHQGGIRIVARRLTKGGITTGYGAMAVGENAVSRLIEKGLLGHGETLADRLIAIDWLRHLFIKAGLPQRVSGKYEGSTSKSTADKLSNPVTLFYRAKWNSVFGALTPERAALVVDVVCFDDDPFTKAIPELIEALDCIVKWQALAERRERKR